MAAVGHLPHLQLLCMATPPLYNSVLQHAQAAAAWAVMLASQRSCCSTEAHPLTLELNLTPAQLQQLQEHLQALAQTRQQRRQQGAAVQVRGLQSAPVAPWQPSQRDRSAAEARKRGLGFAWTVGI
jgi:hypothetical protein